MFRSRVITLTASAESGTGDPIPISCPVSRGIAFLTGVLSDSAVSAAGFWTAEVFELVPFVKDSGFSFGVANWNCGGASGAARSSLGVISIPPFPILGPYMMNCVNLVLRRYVGNAYPYTFFRINRIISNGMSEILEMYANLMG